MGNLIVGETYYDRENNHELEFIGIKNNAYWFKDLTSGVACMIYYEAEFEKYIALPCNQKC